MKQEEKNTWFLPQNSHISKLIQNFDWDKTGLGPLENWSPELCTSLNIMLNSRFPIFLWWGDELRCFYNDAYSTSLGSHRHPKMLGEKAEIAWIDRWEILKPKIAQIKNKGEAIWREDQLTPTLINGVIKDLYWTYCYSPIHDASGEVKGIIVICNETTQKVEIINEMISTQDELRFVLEAAELATWELDINTRELISSPRMYTIFGQEKNVVLTQPMLRDQLFPEDRLNVVDKAWEHALNTGFYKYEARILRPDGAVRWIRTQAQVFFNDPESKPTKLIGTIRDITDEKMQQQVLFESEKKFRLLADSLPQQVWTSDSKGYLNYFNASLFEYTGLSYAQLNDEQWIQVIHPDDRKKFMDNWKRSIISGRVFAFEHRIKRADGSYRWHFTRATAQKDKEGHIKMWVGTSADIHDQKEFTNQLEALVNERTHELEQANIELKKINAELQSFAYVSSHDLQEPLRKIRMFANRILEKEFDKLSGAGKDYFERMEGAAARMQSLIEDLLAYSRTNIHDKVFECVNIQTILDDILKEHKDHITEKNVTIKISNLSEAEVVPFQINQIFTNLLTNSIKFSRDGISPVINIEGSIVQGSVLPGILQPNITYHKIIFKDNGIGFSNTYNEKIFEVFQRLHNRDTYEGTGIGLSIVKKIVDNHKGYIRASGVENEGATFSIYLPLKQAK